MRETKMTTNPFQQELETPNSAGVVFRQPPSIPVDNSTANMINAVSGLAKLGTNEYKQFKHNQVLKGVASETAKIEAAVQQGTIKRPAADIKISALTTSNIVSNPLLAGEIKHVARSITGVDATEAMQQEQRQAQQFEQSQINTGKATRIQTAVGAGYVLTKPDGQPDLQAMETQGAALLQQQQKLQALRETNTSLPTAADRSRAVRRGYEPMLNDVIESKIDVITNQLDNVRVDPATGKYTPEQEKALVQGVQSGLEQTVIQVREDVISAGGSAEDAAWAETRLRDTTKRMVATFTGEYGAAKSAADNLKFFKDTVALPVAQKYSLSVAASNIGLNLDKISIDDIAEAEQDLSYGLGLGETDATQFDSYATLPYKAATAQNTISALNGGKPLNAFSDREQAGILNFTIPAFTDLTREFSTLTPTKRGSTSNALKIISEASAAPSSQSDSQAFTNMLNNSSVRAMLPTLDKDPSTSKNLQKASEFRIDYNERVIKERVTNDPSIKYNPELNVVVGDAFLTSLVQNIDIYYQYSDRPEPIEAFKKSVFNLLDD